MLSSDFAKAIIGVLLLSASSGAVERKLALTCDDCSNVTSTCDDASPSCQCNDGYVALSDSPAAFCLDFDECAEGTSNCDFTNGYCVDYDPPIKFQCLCMPGYTCNSDACTTCIEDTSHPCNINNGDCDSNAECVALTLGRAQCKCNLGFSGNGTTCVADTAAGPSPTPAPFAACETVNQPGSIQCNTVTSQCETINGAPKCTCKSGFISYGGGCSDINECRTTSLNECSGAGRGECVNMAGSFRCQCATGYASFPGTVAGIDCRTPEEIIAALEAGGQVCFVTGLAGISADEFGTGSDAYAIFVEEFAAFFGLSTSQVNVGNVTEYITSRRRTTQNGANHPSHRRAQFTESDFNTALLCSVCISVSDLYAATDSPNVNRIRIDAAIDEVSNKFEDTFATAGSPEISTFLGTLSTRFSNAGVNFDSSELEGTGIDDVSHETVIVYSDQLRPDEILEILIATGNANTTGIFEADVSVSPSAVASGAPTETVPTTPSPSMAPSATRMLNELEEDFFGEEIISGTCTCVDCDFDQRCGGLWKGRVSSVAPVDVPAVHVVMNYCDTDFKWVGDYLTGVSVETFTVLSTCGVEPKWMPVGATLVEGTSYAGWIVDNASKVSGIVVFLEDTAKVSGEKGRVLFGEELVKLAASSWFGCAVEPGTVKDANGQKYSVSAHHKTSIMKSFAGEDANAWFGKAAESSFANLGSYWKSINMDAADATFVPVCYGNSFAASVDSIIARDVEQWKAIDKSVTSMVDKQYMERTWAALLSKSLGSSKANAIVEYSDVVSDDGSLMHIVLESKSEESLFTKAYHLLIR